MALWSISLVISLSSGSAGPNRPVVEYVSLCEMIANPARYDQRTVVTSGVVGPSNVIFDPACRPAAGDAAHPGVMLDLTWANFTDVGDGRGTGKQLDRILDGGMQAFIVVEARFDAYRRYIGRLPDDERVRELLVLGNSRFGPQRCCRFQLAIRQLKLVVPAGPAT